MQFRNTPDRYGAVTKSLHWTISILIICLLCVGIYMTDFAATAQKFTLFRLHKEFGICVLILAVSRLLWHLYSHTPGFVASLHAWEKAAARVAHVYLYVGMTCMPLTGWILSSSAGRTVSFFGFDLPNLVAPDKHIQDLCATIHQYLGYSLIGVIGLHVAGALKHHFIDHDITLKRMLPFGMKAEEKKP